MVTTELVANAAHAGIPALKELFNKLSKEDALKALGTLVVLGISKYAIDAVKDIVLHKSWLVDTQGVINSSLEDVN